MFERGKAIREAKKSEILKKARQKALREEHQRIKAEMEQKGIVVTPEMETILSDNAAGNG